MRGPPGQRLRTEQFASLAHPFVLLQYSASRALTCSLAPRSVVRPLALREFPAQDLSRRGARHFVDELDLAHALVVGDPLLHEGDELLRRGLRVRAQLNESLRDLTGLVVRLSDDTGVGDRGMLAQDRLDLRRSDTESFVLDELLLAIDDEHVALVVAAPNVPGVEPAVADDVCRVLRLVPVALHHLWAADADLADLAVRERLRAGLEIDDLVFGARHHRADRLEHRRIEGIRVRDRRGLGETVALNDRLADALHHPARGIRRQRRRTADEEADRREVVLPQLRAHREAEDDRRDDEADRRALALHERAVLGHVEARHDHLR